MRRSLRTTQMKFANLSSTILMVSYLFLFLLDVVTEKLPTMTSRCRRRGP